MARPSPCPAPVTSTTVSPSPRSMPQRYYQRPSGKIFSHPPPEPSRRAPWDGYHGCQEGSMLEHTPEDIALARLAAIVNSSDDAIVSKGLDGMIMTWNSAAERM